MKESTVSMLQLRLENGKNGIVSTERKELSPYLEHEQEHSAGSDKYPAPSTPQLNHGARLLDDGDCQDQTNCSTEKECGEQNGECKSVETTCGNSVAESTPLVEKPEMVRMNVVKEEHDSADGSILKNVGNDSSENLSKASALNSCPSKSNRKKMKVI